MVGLEVCTGPTRRLGNCSGHVGGRCRSQLDRHRM